MWTLRAVGGGCSWCRIRDKVRVSYHCGDEECDKVMCEECWVEHGYCRPHTEAWWKEWWERKEERGAVG